jgi:hypothetical protein
MPKKLTETMIAQLRALPIAASNVERSCCALQDRGLAYPDMSDPKSLPHKPVWRPTAAGQALRRQGAAHPAE